MASLVVISAIVTIYVILYFAHNVKQNSKDDNKNHVKKTISLIGSGLLVLMSICATALIWALI